MEMIKLIDVKSTIVSSDLKMNGEPPTAQIMVWLIVNVHSTFKNVTELGIVKTLLESLKIL
jgi:RNase P/RNase MRP subunit POP5